MKKLVVAAALMMCLSTSVTIANQVINPVMTEITNDEYTQIVVEDIPQAIKDAIAKDYAQCSIKEAYVKAAEDGTKTYKIVLMDSEQKESHVLFNENGEVIK